MDKNRLEALKQKRLDLKRVEREQSMMDLSSDVIQTLDSKSIDYNLDFESQVWEWICKRFHVHSWGQINWDEVARKDKKTWENEADRVGLYGKIISDNQLTDCLVTVIWSNAERPAFTMSLKDTKAIAEELFDEDFDTWIVSMENGWCIECHHNGHLAIGYLN